jgi:hypothetical protein
MHRVVWSCAMECAVMFRCTRNAWECMGTCKDVSEVHLDVQEGSMDAQKCVGRF